MTESVPPEDPHDALIRELSAQVAMPPSADDLPGRKAPGQRKRGGSGKRPGKQPGAPGAHLAWRDDPDDTVPLFPSGPCQCGRVLAGAADLGISGSRQVIEVPLAAARTVQYDSHAVACACGMVHEAPPPADAGEAGTVTWGPNARALAVFLMVIHHVLVERCAAILESLSGIRPSDGFVHAVLARAARAVRFANMLIRALVVIAGVACADETPIRVGPGPKTRKRYLLVACTNLVTCYFLGDRTLASFGGFVFPDLSGSTAVHDRYQNYDAFGEVAAPAVLRPPAARPGRLRRGLPGRDLARPGRGRAPRPHPRRKRGPRAGTGRRPRRGDRR